MVLILDRKLKGTHEIRVRDKVSNTSTTITIVAKNETIFTLQSKIKAFLANENQKNIQENKK